VTAQWALELVREIEDLPVQAIAGEVVTRFGQGAARPGEVPRLDRLRDALAHGMSMTALEPELRMLSHEGYLRGALVTMAGVVAQTPRPDVALALGRELMDALDPSLGIRLCRAVLAMPEVESRRLQPDSPYCVANQLLGQSMLERDDPAAALRHFEAVLSIDVEDPRALRGWSAASRALEQRGIAAEHRSRGLALLDGLDELELSEGFGTERYELGRPLGRGRHAVVYQAYDRHVAREVAIKRLLDPEVRGPVAPRVLQARFFSEARTLARVRSPFVVSLVDVQPKLRFIAMDLCRGGNLRLAMRRGLVGPADLARVGDQLHAALSAVHAVNAVHRDVKPANILVRTPRQASPIALADFGLAVGPDPKAQIGRAGTLRYLAPELRSGRQRRSTPASDRFSAGVVLLELARTPSPLPEEFDRMDGGFDAASFVPDDLPAPWTERLRALLSSDPEARTW
jgi:tRNA A-37 threonylcarbamoyl transferase component Bud32